METFNRPSDADIWWNGLERSEQNIWIRHMGGASPAKVYAYFLEVSDEIQIAIDAGAVEGALRREHGYANNPYDLQLESYLYAYWLRQYNRVRHG